MIKGLRDTLISVCLLLLLLAVGGRLASPLPSPLDALGSLVAYAAAIAIAAALATRADRHAPLSLASLSHPALLLPLVAPCLLTIYLVAWLCSYLGSLAGISASAALTDPLPLALVRHALFPAVAEELLFRYYPLRRLLPYGRRRAVGVSALLFALAHADIIQLPYALLAGLVFAALDAVTESLVPSLLLHLLNNTLSVLTLIGTLPAWTVPVGLTALLLPSGVLLILLRRRYDELLSRRNSTPPTSPTSTPHGKEPS